MKYRGLVEAFIDVEADSEEEAKKKMIAQLLVDLTNGEHDFTVWEDE